MMGLGDNEISTQGNESKSSESQSHGNGTQRDWYTMTPGHTGTSHGPLGRMIILNLSYFFSLNRRDLNFCMGTSPLCGTAVNVVQEEVEDKLDGGTLSMD